jgi:putative N6-adenine-specific DNA methylase
MNKKPILITCPKGLPPYLKQEVSALGFPVFSETVAGVETSGTLADTMTLNLFLRTAHRVLYHLASFSAKDADELYAKASAIVWEEYLSEHEYLSVHSSVDNPTIDNTLFANLKCKDAIVDRLRKVAGHRPDSGNDMSGAVVFIYWKGNNCSVYLDTSGEPLARRDYRKIPMKAPMQETLAAAVVLETGWNGTGHFVNPMCGSGTLAIEAALIALKRAPGGLRSNYGFMHLKGFDREQWDALRAKARVEAQKSIDGRIIATDSNPAAVNAAKKNAMTAGVDHLIEFSACDFRETPVPEGGGVVVMNPEYGERLGEVTELEWTYKAMGDFLKQKCKGYTGYIFTGNLDLAKKVGLKASRRTPFFNSKIECRLLKYDLYEGTRQKQKTDTED